MLYTFQDKIDGYSVLFLYIKLPANDRRKYRKWINLGLGMCVCVAVPYMTLLNTYLAETVQPSCPPGEFAISSDFMRTRRGCRGGTKQQGERAVSTHLRLMKGDFFDGQDWKCITWARNCESKSCQILDCIWFVQTGNQRVAEESGMWSGCNLPTGRCKVLHTAAFSANIFTGSGDAMTSLWSKFNCFSNDLHSAHCENPHMQK